MEESMLYLHNPPELSHSRLASQNSTKRRRCGVVSSEVWINKGKATTVKAHNCNKLDKCTTITESAKEEFNHGQQENAILGGCEFEVQEQGEGWEMMTSRAKRTRCMYSLEMLRVDDTSLKPSSAAARPASSKLTGCDSSASNSEDPDSDQLSKPSSVVGRKRLKLVEDLKSHNDQQTFNVKDKKRDGIDTKTVEYLDLEAEKLHQSSFAGNCVEATSSFLGVLEIVLMDVQLSVDAIPRAENVPFVSLTSQAFGIAVIGYPLDVGEIRDSSEPLLLSKENDDRGSRFSQLVWRTSKRTPVCYVTSSLSAKNVEDSMLPDGENGLLRKEKALMKLLKNRKKFNRGKTTLNKTCVPVELIFSRILAAVN